MAFMESKRRWNDRKVISVLEQSFIETAKRSEIALRESAIAALGDTPISRSFTSMIGPREAFFSWTHPSSTRLHDGFTKPDGTVEKGVFWTRNAIAGDRDATPLYQKAEAAVNVPSVYHTEFDLQLKSLIQGKG